MVKHFTTIYLYHLILLFSQLVVAEDSDDVNYVTVLRSIETLGKYLHNTGQHEVFAMDMLSVSEADVYTSLMNNITTIADSRNFDVSEKCLLHTEAMMKNLVEQQMWAIKVFDSTGKLGSGLLSGNLLWLGSYHQCHQISQDITLPPGNVMDVFQGKHCTVTVANVSAPKGPTDLAGMMFSTGGLDLGVCVSSICSANDTAGLVNTLISLGSADYGAAKVTCAKDIPLDTSAIVMICILSAIGLILTAATLYDLLVFRKVHHSVTLSSGGAAVIRTTSDKNESEDTGVRSTLRVDEYTPLLHPRTDENGITNEDPVVLLEKKEQSLTSQLLVGVSLYSNCLKLLSVETSSGTLGCLHGIRFLSLTWVILGHTCLFGIILFKNPVIVTELMKDWSFQVILNAPVSVDSFFVLSGALVAYHLLYQLDLVGGPRHFNWILFYFHRFWRLSAPYMLFLGAYVTLFKYWGAGPLWPQAGTDQSCREDWWANLLYVNNIVHGRLGCIAWSWYLACDMQFYIISPIILVLFYKRALFGILITVALWLASTIYTMVVVIQNHYPPGLQGFLVSPGTTLDWFVDVYVKPWCRIGPYLVGLCLGYVLHKNRGRQMRIHSVVVMVAWLAAATCNLTVLYGLFKEDIGHIFSDAESAIYNGLHRTGWALGLAWVIFACVQGYGGIVNKILCWGPFVVLSRMTFMAYLIHPVVMYWYYLSRETPIYLDNLEAVYLFLSFLSVSYGLAFFVTLAIESPLIGLEKVLFKRFRS